MDGWYGRCCVTDRWMSACRLQCSSACVIKLDVYMYCTVLFVIESYSVPTDLELERSSGSARSSWLPHCRSASGGRPQPSVAGFVVSIALPPQWHSRDWPLDPSFSLAAESLQRRTEVMTYISLVADAHACPCGGRPRIFDMESSGV